MSLSELAQFLVSRTSQSRCEACGNPFTCGATLSGCWCSEIKLSDETRAELKTKYGNCLCRECLEKLAGDATKDETP